MPAEELGELAAEIFGEDRVLVRPQLIDAIDDAIRLAEENAIAMGYRRRPDHRLGDHRG